MDVTLLNSSTLQSLNRRFGSCFGDMEWVDPHQLPKDAAELLNHDQDMTGTLERYHGRPIHLETLAIMQIDELLYRKVLLKTDRDDVVEFGAIEIHLDVLDPEPRAKVLGCYQPFGAILTQYQIPFQSRVEGFFRIPTGAELKTLFQMERSHPVFGRVNQLVLPGEKIVAKVVEILPPQNPDLK